jgi:ATP-dependent Clp protease protease subunit
MNYGQEFQSYYTKHLGKPSSHLDYFTQQIESSMTPYILEEREMRVTQMDIFSRLLRDRILWAAGPVNDKMSTVVQAQLMFLDNTDKLDITLHLDSGGGSIKSGLSMIDVMNYITCDVRTVNVGMCASMGAVLLGAGTKGKRSSLNFSRTMIHQSSSGFQGTYADAKVNFEEWTKINNTIFNLLGEYCGKSSEQIKIDADRDLWFSSQETLDYGLIDEIVTKKKGN